MKKRILILTGLLAVCIAGQILLRPCMGSNAYAQALEEEKTADLLRTEDLHREADTGATGSLQGQLFQQFALMLLLVGLIGGGAWLVLKKLPGRLGGNSRSRHITVNETVSLGPRKQLYIVQVGSRQFLIAGTADNIRLLSDVTDVLGETD
jgi:flagellar biosynthetic protein FliO